MQATFQSHGGVAGAMREGPSGGIASALWSYKFWIIFPTLCAFFGSLAVVNMLEERYTGEARVLLEHRETVYSRPDRDTRGVDPAIDPEAVASQVHVLTSKELAIKVIRDLSLANEPEFDPLAKGVGPIKMLMIGLGMVGDPRGIPLEERVLATFQKRLVVVPQGKSRVLSIEFQSGKPELAARVANRIADEYLSRERNAKKETSRSTSEWLDRAIEPLTKKVMEADAKVEAFRAAKGLLIGTNNVTISTQQLGELNTQLSTARSQQADLSARAQIIREALRAGRIFETSEINNNELVRRLLEQRAGLKAQIASDERTLLPNHPRMKELASQLADLEQQVRAAAERAARSLENDSRAAGARVQSMMAEFNIQKKTAALSNEEEVQLKALERDSTALREQLNSYRNKFLDAAARNTDATSPADARVISRAFAQNDPTFPKKLPIILLATLGTMVISMVLIASSALMAQQAQYGYSDAPLLYGAGSAPHAPGTEGPGYMPVTIGEDPRKRPKRGFLGRILARIRKEPLEDEPEPAVSAPIFGSMTSPPGGASAFGHASSENGSTAPVSRTGSDGSDADASHPATERLARELSRLGYLGRAKVAMVFGTEHKARTALHSLRLGRRLAREGAAVVLDMSGTSPLHLRAIGADAEGLVDYLDGAVGLPDILHRDPRSRLHIIPASGALSHLINMPEIKQDLTAVIDMLARSYAFIVVDAGALGGGGEAFASSADLFALLANESEDETYLSESSDRLEALGRGEVFLVADDGGAPSAANDTGGFPRSGVA